MFYKFFFSQTIFLTHFLFREMTGNDEKVLSVISSQILKNQFSASSILNLEKISSRVAFDQEPFKLNHCLRLILQSWIMFSASI